MEKRKTEIQNPLNGNGVRIITSTKLPPRTFLKYNRKVIETKTKSC